MALVTVDLKTRAIGLVLASLMACSETQSQPIDDSPSITMTPDQKTIVQGETILLKIDDDKIFSWFKTESGLCDQVNNAAGQYRNQSRISFCTDVDAFLTNTHFVKIHPSNSQNYIALEISSAELPPDKVLGFYNVKTQNIDWLSNYYLGNEFISYSPDETKFIYQSKCFEGFCGLTLKSTKTLATLKEINNPEYLDARTQRITFDGWIDNNTFSYSLDGHKGHEEHTETIAKATNSAPQTQKSLSIGEPQGPVETYLFCHDSKLETPRSVPLRYKQIGGNITPVSPNNHLYYVPKETDRNVETWQQCQNSPLKIIPAKYEWKDGIIEGEMSVLKYTPPVYGYIDVRKIYERGPNGYSPDAKTQLMCYAIIELNSPTPIVLTPAKTEELKIPYKQKDGKTYAMTSPARLVSGKPEDGCKTTEQVYKFEQRNLDDEVIKYFQTIDVAIP